MSLYFKEPSEGPSVSPGLDLSSSRISSTSGATDDSLDRNLQLQNPYLLYPPQILTQVRTLRFSKIERDYLNPELTTIFSLQIPMPIPSLTTLNNPETICESAASLVFLNIKLARNIPTFVRLPVEDQVNFLNFISHAKFF